MAGDARARRVVELEAHCSPVEVARLHPMDPRAGDLDHHERIVYPVGDLDGAARGAIAGEQRARSDDRDVVRLGGFPTHRIDRALEELAREVVQLAVARAVPGLVEVKPIREATAENALGSVKVRQEKDTLAMQWLARGVGHIRRRVTPMPRRVIMEDQSHLLEVVQAPAHVNFFVPNANHVRQPRQGGTCHSDGDPCH